MSQRAQINFDFAIGVSLLAISMIVALTMVPSLFGGVTEGRIQGDQVAADRVASDLVEGELGNVTRPNELDVDCTVALVVHDTTHDQCGFGATGGDALAQNVGVTDRNVNVTVARDFDGDGDEDVACWDTADGGALIASNDAACDPVSDDDVRLTGGGNAESGNELASAKRRALFEDTEEVTVLVRVW